MLFVIDRYNNLNIHASVRDSTLPLSFISRSTDYRSKIPGLKTREEALSYVASRKTFQSLEPTAGSRVASLFD